MSTTPLSDALMVFFDEENKKIDNLQKQKDELWSILVMLKRELNTHETKPDKLELPKITWKSACERANLL